MLIQLAYFHISFKSASRHTIFAHAVLLLDEGKNSRYIFIYPVQMAPFSSPITIQSAYVLPSLQSPFPLLIPVEN